MLLLALIDKNDIIIGHSLENDLRALRLVHDKVVDTSVIFRKANDRKLSLRHLSNVLLQRKIQAGGGSTGHCSTEDAQASLVLALRRARRGSSFGLNDNAQRQSVLDLFSKNRAKCSATVAGREAGSFSDRNEGSCVCIGPGEWISKYAMGGTHHVLSCDSIMDSMSMAVPSWLSSNNPSKRAGLLWAHLHCEVKNTDGEGRWNNAGKKLDNIVVNETTRC